MSELKANLLQPLTPGIMLKLVCVDDFYTAAKSKLTADGTWDYLEGGSDDQFALQQSRKAFQR